MMRLIDWTIWIAWALCASFFVFALAAASAIPFGNVPLKFNTVARQIGFLTFFTQLLRPWHVFALLVSVVPVVVHTVSRSYRLRVWVPLLCLLALLVWFSAPTLAMAAGHAEVLPLLPELLFKAVAQWLVAIPFAAYFTLSAVLGNQDGEFYQDMAVYIAAGWWMMLCLALAVRGCARTRRHEHAA
jgi:hypothetical protein